MIREIIKSATRVLFTDPNLLYREERHLSNQPFHFEGANGKAVLLIHGWTSTPYEVRRLGKYLNENGYTVRAPQLRGHGTVPKDLENVSWRDWLEDMEKVYAELRAKHSKVFIGGTSIGSNIAALLASRHPEISGLVLMAAPYRLRMERLVILFARFLLLFKNYNRKIYLPSFGVATTITRVISYQTYPIKSSLETAELIQESRASFSSITQPCLIMQSTHDYIVHKNSLEDIYNSVKSPKKRKKYISRAYHTFISDIKNEGVFEEILNFLNEN